VPYQFDGFPGKITVDGKPFDPTYEHGHHYDYVYPLTEPNFSGNVHGDHFERACTLWYHDHVLDFTGPNVYRGLAGFFLVYDNPIIDAADVNRAALFPNTLDTGDESGPASTEFTSLRLPSGKYDIPLVLQEKTFGSNGELMFNQFDTDGFMGEHYLVNGKVQPYLDVKRRKYRFRFLNGSNARIYHLFLTDNTGRSWPMTQIATEGGLLSRSIKRSAGFMLGMAERVEVVIDFKEFPHPQFTELYIENRMIQDDGRGPDGTFERPKLSSRGTRLLKFRLGAVEPEPLLRVPEILRPFPAICAADIAAARKRTRTFEFERGNGQWQINDKLAGDLSKPMATPTIDVPEVWRLVNKSGGWWHPIHVHHEFMRVLSRNGRKPFGGTGSDWGQSVEADGIARKDTILLGPNSEVDVYVRFSNYPGPYVFHCHNMEHEDHQMMARFDVLPAVPGTGGFVSGCTTTAAASHH
jgi:FtsP/CotA-like multicopper oxidase with cupredoxin domain